jgi:hypothetical protein
VKRALLTSFAPLALLVLALIGCGTGGGDSPSTSAETAAHSGTTPTQTSSARNQQKGDDTPNTPPPASRRSEPRSEPGPPAAAFTPTPHHDSGGGPQQFRVEGADNSVQEFGAEADPSEFDQAAAALHAFLDARAQRNWAAACTYLSTETKYGFTRLPVGSGRDQPASCAATLAALSDKVPTSTLREAAVADVGSLRVESEQAFLIYRGAPGGTIYAIPLRREAGAWRIASLAGTPLN